MSSNPPAEVVPAGGGGATRGINAFGRLRSPRTWTLRARLLATQVVLLAVVCVCIGGATTVALQRFLIHQLNTQLVEAGRRSAVLFSMPRPPSPPPGFSSRDVFDPAAGPGPAFLGAPGQSIHTVGAVIDGGRDVDAGLITGGGLRSAVSQTAAAQLAAIPVTHRPVTVDLDGLGPYRLVAIHSRTGPIVVVGLPMAGVEETMVSMYVWLGVVTAVALVVATLAGIVVIRRQLAPLARVSAAARDVAELELERGEVQLPTSMVSVDPASAHTEVGQLSAALNRMVERIAEALSARHASETRVRQFVADASHELRTPLAAIRGYTELAQRRRGSVPDDVAHAMGRVESETRRMTQLVEDMLLLARLDDGRPLEREPVDLTRLALDAVSDAHIAGADHRWSLDVPDEPVVVVGDDARLRQVLANLLANSRTHTPPGTTVTTSLAGDEGGGAVLTVVDDGPGIPAGLQPEVFERFARGDSARSRRVGSTGLGLAIVAAVVKAHDGTITVYSVPGKTEFTVRLPGSGVTHSPDSSDAQTVP
jgi:two-component system OmpR family sensor kinase